MEGNDAATIPTNAPVPVTTALVTIPPQSNAHLSQSTTAAPPPSITPTTEITTEITTETTTATTTQQTANPIIPQAIATPVTSTDFPVPLVYMQTQTILLQQTIPHQQQQLAYNSTAAITLPTTTTTATTQHMLSRVAAGIARPQQFQLQQTQTQPPPHFHQQQLGSRGSMMNDALVAAEDLHALSNSSGSCTPEVHELVSTVPAFGVMGVGGPSGLLAKSCNCRNSRCLKLYCECFANSLFCHNRCNCTQCMNNSNHMAHRIAAIHSIMERNPDAFKPKITAKSTAKGKLVAFTRHAKGCHCKKSGCKKKYCECFQNGIACTDACKCVNCCNRVDHPSSSATTTILLESHNSNPSTPQTTPPSLPQQTAHSSSSNPPPFFMHQQKQQLLQQRVSSTGSSSQFGAQQNSLFERGESLAHVNVENANQQQNSSAQLVGGAPEPTATSWPQTWVINGKRSLQPESNTRNVQRRVAFETNAQLRHAVLPALEGNKLDEFCLHVLRQLATNKGSMCETSSSTNDQSQGIPITNDDKAKEVILGCLRDFLQHLVEAGQTAS